MFARLLGRSEPGATPSLFDKVFAAPVKELLSNPTLQSDRAVYEGIGKIWAEAHRYIVEHPDEGYTPTESGTLEDDLLGAVMAALPLLWNECKPTVKGRVVPRKYKYLDPHYQKHLKALERAAVSGNRGGAEERATPLASPPGLDQGARPREYAIDTPAKASRAGQLRRSEVEIWAEAERLDAFAAVLVDADLRRLDELRVLQDPEVNALLAAAAADGDGPKVGEVARFRLALQGLQPAGGDLGRQGSVEPGSGWVREDTGAELTAGQFGQAEKVVFEDAGRGVVLQGERLVAIRRKDSLGGVGLGTERSTGRGGMEGTTGYGKGAARGGPEEPNPLKELRDGALAMMAQLQTGEEPSTSGGTGFHGGARRLGAGPGPYQGGSSKGGTEAKAEWGGRPVSGGHPADEWTAGGRLVVHAGERAESHRVTLKCQSRQAAAIYEEWSNGEMQRMQEVVASRTWKSVEAKRAAFDIARTVDVMADSGLDVTKEPAAEVLLRSLAAGWFADRHPKDADVGEWLKESSMANFGIPRALFEEAKTFKKLAAAASADGA